MRRPWLASGPATPDRVCCSHDARVAASRAWRVQHCDTEQSEKLQSQGISSFIMEACYMFAACSLIDCSSFVYDGSRSQTSSARSRTGCWHARSWLQGVCGISAAGLSIAGATAPENQHEESTVHVSLPRPQLSDCAVQRSKRINSRSQDSSNPQLPFHVHKSPLFPIRPSKW